MAVLPSPSPPVGRGETERWADDLSYAPCPKIPPSFQHPSRFPDRSSRPGSLCVHPLSVSVAGEGLRIQAPTQRRDRSSGIARGETPGSGAFLDAPPVAGRDTGICCRTGTGEVGTASFSAPRPPAEETVPPGARVNRPGRRQAMGPKLTHAPYGESTGATVPGPRPMRRPPLHSLCPLGERGFRMARPHGHPRRFRLNAPPLSPPTVTRLALSL